MNILLGTLNSTYQHTAFGLRYLYANLGAYQSQAQVLEWTIHKDPLEIAHEISLQKPKILGLGVYIWNTDQTLKLLKILKEQMPELIVVLGGPEVSYESEGQEICKIADYVIKGEADFLFREFCHQILELNQLPAAKFISGPLPLIDQIISPYRFFSELDIKNRIVYVEASRGCPYKCEYCLSSLDKSVRNFNLENFLSDMQVLIDRGLRQFKFIDRTFNLSPKTSTAILHFFLERVNLGLFLHFEMVPDRLPDELKVLIKKFPAGSLQFEIGIQTLNPVVAALVSRKNDLTRVEENLRFLAHETGVHTHVDLIAGLPGEDMHSFAKGFDQLLAMDPDEIQVGILKRLKGTPINRHDREWEMNYDSVPPFQILSTKTMSAEEILMMQRFSKFWDMIANRGQFKNTWTTVRDSLKLKNRSAFFWFLDLSKYLSLELNRTYSIPLLELCELFLIYLTEHEGWDKILIQNLMAQDYKKGNRRDLPHFLKNDSQKEKGQPSAPLFSQSAIPKRQLAHLKA